MRLVCSYRERDDTPFPSVETDWVRRAGHGLSASRTIRENPNSNGMGDGGKTDLQREILLTWHQHPNATNKEIARACDCSASYVSQVKNRFDDYDEFEAMMDRQDRELERMFGGDIFAGQRGQASARPMQSHSGNSTESINLAEAWDELPNNPVGHLIRAIILVILLYVLYEVLTILVL